MCIFSKGDTRDILLGGTRGVIGHDWLLCGLCAS
jgi:hypothetical protein